MIYHYSYKILSFRFEGVIQGKELDAILRDEGLEEDETLVEDPMELNVELDNTESTAVEIILVSTIFSRSMTISLRMYVSNFRKKMKVKDPLAVNQIKNKKFSPRNDNLYAIIAARPLYIPVTSLNMSENVLISQNLLVLLAKRSMTRKRS